MGAMIPLPIMAAPDLSPGAKLCYAAMCRFAGRDGRCFPSERELGEKLRVSERSARSYVAELVSHGYIERERRRRSETNNYFFLWRDEFADYEADRQNPDARDRQNPDAKVSQLRETLDSDYAPRFAGGESSPRAGALRAEVERHLGRAVSNSALGRIVAAGGGAGDAQLIAAISAAVLRSKDAPRSARWFEVAVAEHVNHAGDLRPAAPGAIQPMKPEDVATLADSFCTIQEAA